MKNPSDPGGFGQFVPGFDFLQQLAQGGNASLASWVAPTLDAEALDKRIAALKAVQFWLDQNAAALKATLQALEVQKMTLATLKTMNVPMPGAGLAWPAATPAPAAQPKAAPAARTEQAAAAAAPLPDPMQFWGALTQQFQQIAGQALQDVARRSAAATQTPTRAAKPAPAAKPAAPTAKKATARSRRT